MILMRNVLKRIELFVNDNIILIAIRRGLTRMIPLMMAGSLALLIVNFPLSFYQDFLTDKFGDTWKNLGLYIYNGTFAVLALVVLLSISWSLSESFIQKYGLDISPAVGSLVSFACYLILMKFGSDSLNLAWLGAVGMFLAIIVAIISNYLFHLLYRIKRLHIHIYSDTADDSITTALKAIFPAIITFAIFAIIHMIFDAFGIYDIHETLYNQLQRLFGTSESASLSTGFVFVFFSHFFWFIGLHGNNVLEPIAQSVFAPNIEVNQMLAQAGEAPAMIFTKEFFDVFVFLGGSGATLCLIIAIIIAVRKSNSRQIATMSLVTGVFNVNELMTYGLPIVFNIYFLLPFIFVPVILMLVTWAAMALGLVPLTVSSVNWTTPIFLSGYISTGSVAGSILQLVNVAIGIVCYIPFVRLFEKNKQREYMRDFKLLQDFLLNDENSSVRVLDRRDNIGNLARAIASVLKEHIANKNLYLEYQPQVTNKGTLFGVEALLRWRHPRLGNVSPVTAVRIADEAGISDELSRFVVDEALSQLRAWQDSGKDVRISINLSPKQLYPTLHNDIDSALKKYRIDPKYVEFEITEQTALGGKSARECLSQLKALGVRLAMDDFGMGHSSLMYLMEFHIDTIKLDGVLVKDVVNNHTSRDIIYSVATLCRSSGIDIVAEYVETEEQRIQLELLGCMIYQGYLFSKSLSPEAFEDFYRKFGDKIAD